MRKNEIAAIEITGYTAEGNGVGRLDGMAVFVPGAAVGDTLQVRIVKTLKTMPLEKSKSLSFRQKTGSFPTVLAFPSAADAASATFPIKRSWKPSAGG